MRISFGLKRLGLDDLNRAARALRHPAPLRRAQAAYLLGCHGDAALPYADRLLPLLRDPDPEVRQRAAWALTALGPGLVPQLRRVRADGPGPLRRGALTVLAALDPGALGERDRAALRRLIRVKLPGETPQPVHLCGTWLAVRTADQAALLAALDLSDPEPVTLRLGESAWNHDHHSWDLDLDDHRAHGRVWVTGAVDGWTLVFGALADTAHVDMNDAASYSAAAGGLCARLSARFGAAHLYYLSCGDGLTLWCLSEHGQVRRYYQSEELSYGERHPAEDGYLLPDEDPGFPPDAFGGVEPADVDAAMARHADLDHEHAVPRTCYADDIAAGTSVNPAGFGPHTRITGHSVLALTACGRAYGTAPGALAI